MDEVESVLDQIVETLQKVKTKYSDPIIIVGGDFNKKKDDLTDDSIPRT